MNATSPLLQTPKAWLAWLVLSRKLERLDGGLWLWPMATYYFWLWLWLPAAEGGAKQASGKRHWRHRGMTSTYLSRVSSSTDNIVMYFRISVFIHRQSSYVFTYVLLLGLRRCDTHHTLRRSSLHHARLCGLTPNSADGRIGHEIRKQMSYQNSFY